MTMLINSLRVVIVSVDRVLYPTVSVIRAKTTKAEWFKNRFP